MAKRAETAHVAELKARKVLLLIDVIHTFDCEDGELLHRRTLPIVPAIARLRRAFPRTPAPPSTTSGTSAPCG